MASIIKKIEYLKIIFKGINLNVRSKITDEIDDMFNSDGFQELYKEPTEEDLIITLGVLEDALRDAKKELKNINKKNKDNTSTPFDLLPYKQIIEDLTQQIKDIKSNLNG